MNKSELIKSIATKAELTNKQAGAALDSGSYRRVEEAVCYMLGLTATEAQKWIFDFLAPMRETMKAGE